MLSLHLKQQSITSQSIRFYAKKQTLKKRKPTSRKQKKLKIPKGYTIEKLLKGEPLLSYHFKGVSHDPTNMEPLQLKTDKFAFEYGQVVENMYKLKNKEFRISNHHNLLQKIAEKHSLFPDIVLGFRPRMLVRVKYGDNMASIGNMIDKEIIEKGEPEVDFESRGMGIWTLAMVSRDRATGEKIVHWLKSNITNHNVKGGSTVIPYKVNFQGYGLKLISFVLFQQSKIMEDFSVKNFENLAETWEINGINPKALAFCYTNSHEAGLDQFSGYSAYEGIQFDLSKEFRGR
jgi:hypothetical protein